VTVRTKAFLILGALVSLELAILGARVILADAFAPIIKALGG